MFGFVSFAPAAPRAATLQATPRVCAARLAPAASGFVGAPVAVARPARNQAATIRMDVTVVVGDSEPIGTSHAFAAMSRCCSIG